MHPAQLRTFLQSLLLVLTGAAIVIVTCWATAAMTQPSQTLVRAAQYRGLHHWAPCGSELILCESGVATTRSLSVPDYDNLARYTWGDERAPRLTAASRPDDMPPDAVQLRYAVGWPWRAFEWQASWEVLPPPGGFPPLIESVLDHSITGGLEIASDPQDLPFGLRAFPIRPIPAGWIADTGVATIVLWIVSTLFAQCRRLRHRRRVRRGLCRVCGYPVQQQARCSECGTSVGDVPCVLRPRWHKHCAFWLMTAFAICAVAYVAAAQPRRHISPLHAAVWSGRIETLEALIASGAAVDVRLTHDRPSSEAGGMTPLMLAARLGRADMVSVLIDAGADPLRGSGPYGHRALAHAAARGHRDVMRVLLSDTRRTNISPHLYRGSTLGTAAYHGQFEIVSEFMPRDGRNLSPPLIDLPLFRYIAAGRTEGHAKIIELFLCSGLDPNLDAHGAPLLIHAVGTGHLRTIEALLSHGADPSSMDWQGRSTLDHAAIRGDVAVLKLVLGSVDEEAVQDADAILFAAAHCDAEGLQLLLDGGASIARTDAQGRGVLHYACAFGRADNLNALLAYGADVDQRDQSGETAAFVAARQYPREFAETFQLAVMRLVLVDLDRDGLCLAKLRSAHADLSIRSLAGTTVADVVAKSGNAARQRSAGGNVSETKIE